MSYALAERPRPLQELLADEPYASTGPELREVLQRASQYKRDYYFAPMPVTRIQEFIEGPFRALVDQWLSDNRYESSLTAMTSHPAYRQIIRLGPAAVPLVLRELERSPNHWFTALNMMTGVDPVRPEDQGDLDAMAAAWLRWGREQDLSW